MAGGVLTYAPPGSSYSHFRVPSGLSAQTPPFPGAVGLVDESVGWDEAGTSWITLATRTTNRTRRVNRLPSLFDESMHPPRSPPVATSAHGRTRGRTFRRLAEGPMTVMLVPDRTPHPLRRGTLAM